MLEWECCVKSPEQGADGGEFGAYCVYIQRP